MYYLSDVLAIKYAVSAALTIAKVSAANVDFTIHLTFLEAQEIGQDDCV